MTDSTFFINYAQYGVFRDVRIAALECLVDVIKSKYIDGSVDLYSKARYYYICIAPLFVNDI